MKITYNKEPKIRIDHFLTKELSITRSQLQKIIKAGEVLVNGNKVTPHYTLQLNDIIEYKITTIKKIKTTPRFKPNADVNLDIIFENDDYLILNKPTNLLVHPTDKMEQNTIANALIAKYPKIKTVGDNKLRPGIVHRLDKNVSGLLLITKTQKAFDYYKNLFKTRNLEKIYIALVHGTLELDYDIIELRISRSKSKGRMAAHPVGSELGKDAKTEYDVLKRFLHFTLLKIKLHTGRTHQIRTHFNAIGHPIVGDPLYKQRNNKQKLNVSRPFLHAKELSFIDQNGNKVHYESPLPNEFNEIIERIT